MTRKELCEEHTKRSQRSQFFSKLILNKHFKYQRLLYSTVCCCCVVVFVVLLVFFSIIRNLMQSYLEGIKGKYNWECCVSSGGHEKVREKERNTHLHEGKHCSFLINTMKAQQAQ